MAVCPDRLAGGLPGLSAGSQPCTGQASQHISCAPDGQPSVACRVDPRRVSGRGNDGARSLEDHAAVKTAGQLMGRFQPVGLHFVGADSEQTSGFQGVVRQYSGMLTRRSIGQQALQPGVLGHTVEGIGIEHQAGAALQYLPQSLGNRVTASATRDHGQALEATLAEHKVWEKRKPLLRQALQRLTLGNCRQLLGACSRTDRMIKGVEPGSPWDALRANGLRLAGVELLPEER